MRKYAIVERPTDNVKKLMIYECDEGTYVFKYNTIKDAPAFGDSWFEKIKDAEELCERAYKVKDEDWIDIDDPIEHCQHDIIAPVRIKGRDVGKPQWGTYEKFIDGNWYEVELTIIT